MRTRDVVSLRAPDECAIGTVVRPRFYCGQLLTDTDMTALVDWGRQRFALSRHRDGWGVVCGLDVRSTPKAPGSVTIRPGYAVGCCGDDIVVAHDHVLDLSPIGEKDRRSCGDRGVPQELPLPVDVFLSYREEDAEPHTAYARSCCAETAECENSRTREVFHAYARRAPGWDDPVATVAQAWKLGYDACLNVIKQYLQDFPKHEPGRARKWLLQWIDENPGRQSYGLRDAIGGSENPSERDIAGWLYRIVQDARGAYVTGTCPGCAPDAGVRLARVSLQAAEDGSWYVDYVDVYPPFRRPLGVEAWPAPLGSVNAAQTVRHRWPDASARLARLGVAVAGTDQYAVPGTVADLAATLPGADPFVEYGSPVVAVLHGPRQRVVGFRRAAGGAQQAEVKAAASTGRLTVTATVASPELTRISGIAAGRAAALRAGGIGDMAALASSTPERIHELLPHVGVRTAAKWIETAREMLR